MIDVIHGGPNGCGKVAFRVTRRPRRTDVITARESVLLDGSTPEPHTLIRCGSCGSSDGAGAWSVDGGFEGEERTLKWGCHVFRAGSSRCTNCGCIPGEEGWVDA